MKVKLNWLNELVDLSGLTTEDIVNKMSLYSTEIEGVEKILFGTNLVIGHVLTCVDHPHTICNTSSPTLTVQTCK